MSPSRPKPPAYTVDTDVVIGGVRAFQQPPVPSEPVEASLLRRWLRGEWQWIVSAEMLDEYRNVLLTRGARPSRVARLIVLVSQHSRVVGARRVRATLPDPDDEHVIGTARAAGCAVLTRNVAHFPASLVRSVTPEQAMAEIDVYLRHPMRRRRLNRPRTIGQR